MSWPCLGLRLLLLAAGGPVPSEEKKPVPVYTNEDLDRISPHRDETGVNSHVVVAVPPSASTRASDDGRARSEAYWRRQAESLHVRLQRARDRMDDLRARIAEKEAKADAPLSSRSRRGRASPASSEAQIEALRRQLAALEARVRDEEARFEDRARREGALPGWLR
jgi:peptidoglycan hydrolase CwlO-like protein